MQRSYGRVIQIYLPGCLQKCRRKIYQATNILANVVPYKGGRNLGTDFGV